MIPLLQDCLWGGHSAHWSSDGGVEARPHRPVFSASPWPRGSNPPGIHLLRGGSDVFCPPILRPGVVPRRPTTDCGRRQVPLHFTATFDAPCAHVNGDAPHAGSNFHRLRAACSHCSPRARRRTETPCAFNIARDPPPGPLGVSISAWRSRYTSGLSPPLTPPAFRLAR